MVYEVDQCAGSWVFSETMREKSELWKELCAKAAVEQDPAKLLELTRQINDLLLGKQRRLESENSPRMPNDTK
jgi:hypothetical protein